MEKFVAFLKGLGIKLLEIIVILVVVMLVDFIIFKLTDASIVNLFQQVVYVFNLLIDKIQSWYIK